MKDMEKYICKACGYIYDPHKEYNGLQGATAFFDLPDNWHCPLCGVNKLEFEKW
ncbi:Rubredoxin-type Fe(Cys)4 protein domain protein [Candidatus Magnetoovum chiemensis]|nr:Rubredoxin-type Fe(Cys)4 protein domain protein [Candidatus Magnetoovum chiemensis]